MRGYWFTYRATPPGTSMPMHPQLERLKYGLGHYAAKKGGVGQKAFGCQYTNQKKAGPGVPPALMAVPSSKAWPDLHSNPRAQS